ncbi:hypothetical protein Patl1_13330 [Pistacia atlantica]|uniref:Uncharacterized protein n=1 Tax=Pistacia atlantica TaxID=434234 RepID=A0ACC1AYF9_9ROSI|nr:hypothetical protein Patl1_13330 [Pistacia atlantica]
MEKQGPVKNGAEPCPATNRVSLLNCIDLSSPDIHQSVSLIKQACLDCGFFYVINHGISQEFMDEVFGMSKRFFELPLNEKMKLLRNEKHRGYTPVLDELLDPDNQVHVGDYKEGYYIGVEVPEGDPEAEKPFYGPNVWPAPDVLPGWRDTMERFHREALVSDTKGYFTVYSFLFSTIEIYLIYYLCAFREVAKAVARIIALALDLEVDFFDKPEMLGEPIATLRLLHYEGQVSDPVKGIYGAGAHSDFGLITLLATDDVLGLQICKDKGAKPQIWEYVAPVKGSFIVNLGDMLERWSNCIFNSGRLTWYKEVEKVIIAEYTTLSTSVVVVILLPLLVWSTLHRVLGNGRERYSIAYFVEPSHDCLVECLPTCKSEKNPPKFPPVKCGTYLCQRYKDTHADLNVYNKLQN